jgi:ATP-dependent protease ClpP protease subunit
MVHDGDTSVVGTHKQAQSQVSFEKAMKVQMMDIYSSVCVNGDFFCEEYSEDDVKNFIEEKLEKKEDWWMSADEAVEYGFADGTLGTPGFETILDIKNNWENESE